MISDVLHDAVCEIEDYQARGIWNERFATRIEALKTEMRALQRELDADFGRPDDKRE